MPEVGWSTPSQVAGKLGKAHSPWAELESSVGKSIWQACRFEAQSPEPEGRNKTSPGRKPWVRVHSKPEPLQGRHRRVHCWTKCAVPEGLGSLTDADPGLTSWACAALRAGGWRPSLALRGEIV